MSPGFVLDEFDVYFPSLATGFVVVVVVVVGSSSTNPWALDTAVIAICAVAVVAGKAIVEMRWGILVGRVNNVGHEKRVPQLTVQG